MDELTPAGPDIGMVVGLARLLAEIPCMCGATTELCPDEQHGEVWHCPACGVNWKEDRRA